MPRCIFRDTFSKIYSALRSLLFPTVWPLRNLREVTLALQPDWEPERRGWRTPRNFGRRTPVVQKFPIFSSPQSPWRDPSQSLRWIVMIFLFSENIFYQVETAFGKLVEERFEYLIVHGLFPLTEGLGALPRPPQTNQTSASTIRASFQFPSKLVSILPRTIWFEYLIFLLRQTASADKLPP